MYSPPTAEVKPSMLILLKLRPQLVGANGGYKFINPHAHVLFAIAEGSDPAGPGGGDLIQDIASACGENNVGLVYRNRSFLEKEYFCLELELLSVCREVSSSAIDYLQ